MSNNKDIGKIFKNKLSNREFEMKAAYWKNMEQMLDTPAASSSSKKGFWWLFSSFFIFLFSIGLVWFWNSKETTSEKYISETNITPSITESTENKPHTATASVKNNKSISETNNSNNQLNNSQLNSSIKNYNKKNKYSIDDVDTEKSDLITKVNKNESTITTNSSIEEEFQKTTLIAANDKNSFPSKDISYSSESISQKKYVKTSSINSNKESISLGNDDLLASNSNELDQKESSESLFDYNEIEVSPTMENNKLNYMQLLYADLENEKIRLPDSITTKRDMNAAFKVISPWSISAFGGINNVQANYKMLSENYVSNEVSTKKAPYKPLLSAGLELNYHLQNWNFSSGININQFGENTEYVKTLENEVIEDNSYWDVTNNSYYDINDYGYWETDYVFSSGSWQLDSVIFISSRDSTFIELIDSSFVQKIDTTITLETIDDNSTQNIFTYIEIPFIVGYEIPINRWSINFRTGFSVNYLSKITGTQPTEDGFETLVTSHKTKTNINYLLRINADYHINKTWSVFVAPNYKTQLINISKNESYSQKYRAMGLNIGVNYRF